METKEIHMNKEIKVTEMICFKILLIFIISIACIGCTSNKTSSNKTVESSINTKDDSITVEYDNNFSWNISGNGSFELLILNWNDSQLDERLSKKYDLSDNKTVTLSFSIDENLNLSYADNISKITDVIQSENDLKKDDMDTSYTQTERQKLSDEESVPLLLFCKNMTSIQSEFLKDYKSLMADYAVVVVIKKAA